jgi:hypothetical protein
VWHWFDERLESVIANQLSARGLPWDLVWVDDARDEQGRPEAIVNLSPVVLNEWLVRQAFVDGLALRLAALRVEHDAVSVSLQLVPQPPSVIGF